MSSNITIRTTTRSKNNIIVRTTPKNRITINNKTGIGPSNQIDTIVELKDVDAGVLETNETLVYDGNSGKFVVRELPIINGGTF